MKLVALQVRIGIIESSNKTRHEYPPFNELPENVRGGIDWSTYIDRFGGWHYDKAAGHADHDPKGEGEQPGIDSPSGTWLGFFLVPRPFADAAVAKWPDQCEIIDERTCAAFYEKRCVCYQPDVLEDLDALQAIAAKRAIGQPETAEDRNALDPDHPSRGLRKNKAKTWAGLKKQRGFEIE